MMNKPTTEVRKPKPQIPASLGSTNDIFQTFFAYETNLNSEDLGQVVKSLYELKKILITTENKLLLNSIVSKLATNFEFAKNLHKYQYFEIYKFFQALRPFFQGIQNKKEILDITSKVLTSNDYISRIISTQFITLLKDYIEDRVDVLHNLMSVALTTKSQLEIRFLFKSFLELCEVSEAFSFTFLQQFRQLFDQFAIVIPKKRIVVLVQKSARNISKEQNVDILVQNLKVYLELDMQSLQRGKNNWELIHANIILMGNLLLYTFSHTSEIIPLILGVFFFLTDNPINDPTFEQNSYSLCKLIINLFKRLFKLIPSLKSVLTKELDQMMNRALNSKQIHEANNNLFLEMVPLLSDPSQESITSFFMQLSDEMKMIYILQSEGNQSQLESSYVKNLFCSRIEALTSEYPSQLLSKNFNKVLKLIKSLNDQDILDIFKNIRIKVIDKLKNTPPNNEQLTGLIELGLLTVVSLSLKTQETGNYPSNVSMILQDEVCPILNLLKTADKSLFDSLFKKVFLITLELGKMAVSTQTNPHRYENAVLESFKNMKNCFSKALLYWMARKALTNNYFILCRWLSLGLSHYIKSENVLVWLEVIRSLCNICCSDKVDENKTLQLMKTINSIKLIKSENTFTYQYLRCLFFLHSSTVYLKFLLKSEDFQEIHNLIHSKGSIEKPLMQIYGYLAELKLLEDKFFIDEIAKVGLKVFIYAIQFIIALLENPIEMEDNPRSLEERLEIINKKITKWVSSVPFHDGEIEIMKYFRNAYQKAISTRDWATLRANILDDFLNFKIITFPRAFLDLKQSLGLRMKLVNQDEYINKKTNEINANSAMRYVMDVRVHLSHLPKNFNQNLQIHAEAIVNFHHNFGSKDDVVHQISNMSQTLTLSPHQRQTEISFLLHFTSIGKFTFKMTLKLINKKSRIIHTKSETWVLNVY